MARQLGKDVRVYLGGRDVSGDLTSIGFDMGVEALEVTTFDNADWKYFDAGMKSWSAAIEGWYDTSATGIQPQLTTLLGTQANSALSVYDGDADAVGETGIIGAVTQLTQFGQPIDVNGVVHVVGALAGASTLGANAKLLTPLAAVTASGTNAVVDSGVVAGTTYGGLAVMHITAVAGTPTITINVKHSADDATYATVATFTAATATGSQAIAVAAGTTILRYCKGNVAVTGTGTVTYVMGLARFAAIGG